MNQDNNGRKRVSVERSSDSQAFQEAITYGAVAGCAAAAACSFGAFDEINRLCELAGEDGFEAPEKALRVRG